MPPMQDAASTAHGPGTEQTGPPRVASSESRVDPAHGRDVAHRCAAEVVGRVLRSSLSGDRAIAEVAAAQYGVVTRGQLAACPHLRARGRSAVEGQSARRRGRRLRVPLDAHGVRARSRARRRSPCGRTTRSARHLETDRRGALRTRRAHRPGRRAGRVAPPQRPARPPRAPAEVGPRTGCRPYSCQAPPRNSGTCSPPSVTPVTATSSPPIMKSTWIEEWFRRDRSSSPAVKR
jgi:hypothetical protein